MTTNDKNYGEVTDSSDYIHHINPLSNPLRLKIQATYPIHTTAISCPSLALPSRSFSQRDFQINWSGELNYGRKSWLHTKGRLRKCFIGSPRRRTTAFISHF
ncbi:hypothetical protein CEXT_801911 [Caerostris extrusa]|uniref:Uncharacterized protein n=1 Tax=Caerostris extrusa TaxID=172846 RepID=A0AAV4WH93_CAEEX|nr:hypothetical protein CEXT_801911 [Caerostris extrusa]